MRRPGQPGKANVLHVHQSRRSDRRSEYLRRDRVELIKGKISQCQCQQHHDDAVQLLSGEPRDRGFANNIDLTLEPLRSNLECSGEDQGRDESYRQKNDNVTKFEIAVAEGGQDGLDHLDDEPGCHHVGQGHANDIPALEFVEQRH